MPAGYSKTPLYKKLGIKEGFNILLYNPPTNYFDLFSEFPDNTKVLQLKRKESTDFIHMFCDNRKQLETSISQFKKALKHNGMLWVSWPKGSSKIITDLNREYVRTIVLSTGLVDIKVVAIDEDWSGLKFVYRLEDRN